MNYPTVKLEDAIKVKVIESIEKYPDLDLSIDFDSAARVNGYTRVSIVCNKCNTLGERKISLLYSGKYHCAGCKIEEYKELCTKLGKIYVTHDCGRYGVRLTTKCSECLTLSSFEPTKHKKEQHSRKECTTCLIEKYKDKCKATGRTYVSHEIKGKTTKITAKCDICTAPWSFQPNAIVIDRPNRLRCPNCQRLHIEHITKEAGYDFVSKVKGGVRVKCTIDGTEMDVTTRHLENKNIRCDTCLLNKHKSQLAEKGCQFIEYIKIKNKATRVRYYTPTNLVLDTTIIALNAGKFATSDKGQWCDPHKTYLIHLEHNGVIYCKIGTAQLPEKRLEWLRLTGEAKVFTLNSFNNRFEAAKLESLLHKEFAKFKLPHTVAVGFTTREIIVKRVPLPKRRVIKDGTTEWFTSEVFPILAKRYNLETSSNEFDKHPTGAVAGTGH